MEITVDNLQLVKKGLGNNKIKTFLKDLVFLLVFVLLGIVGFIALFATETIVFILLLIIFIFVVIVVIILSYCYNRACKAKKK